MPTLFLTLDPVYYGTMARFRPECRPGSVRKMQIVQLLNIPLLTKRKGYVIYVFQ
jgi:hypothetical protein